MIDAMESAYAGREPAVAEAIALLQSQDLVRAVKAIGQLPLHERLLASDETYSKAYQDFYWSLR